MIKLSRGRGGLKIKIIKGGGGGQFTQFYNVFKSFVYVKSIDASVKITSSVLFCIVVIEFKENIRYHKVTAQWIPRLLTEEHKNLRWVLLLQHVMCYQQQSDASLYHNKYFLPTHHSPTTYKPAKTTFNLNLSIPFLSQTFPTPKETLKKVGRHKSSINIVTVPKSFIWRDLKLQTSRFDSGIY